MFQRQLFRSASEKLDVLGIGTRPSTFNEVHAKKIQLFGNTQFVFDRGRNTFHLHAIAQCGVKSFHHLRLGRCLCHGDVSV